MRRSLLLFSLLITLSNFSWAESPKVIELRDGNFAVVKGVNVRNGNFSVTYTTSKNNDDPSGIPFDRVYNSRSEVQSSFGLGWGSKLDNTIEFDYTGSLAINENGTVKSSTYKMKDDSPGRKEYLSKDGFIKRKLISLENQAQDSRAEARKALIKKGALADDGQMVEHKPYPPIPDGSIFVVDQHFIRDACAAGSTIRREGDRIIRILGNNCPTARETYTLYGKLINIQSRESSAGASIKFVRDPITTLITSVTDEKGKVTRFQYDSKKRLIRQDYPDGIWQSFEYDNRDNMTTIIYIDGSKQTMTYDAKDRVLSVTPRASGPTASFEYLEDPVNKDVSYTRVTLSEQGQKSVTVFKLL